ncbi:hypothetical protein Q3G72_006041 [Acer saccharum]|nr:hypothetical protein Q3G72_006041 [Acer saccharum]
MELVVEPPSADEMLSLSDELISSSDVDQLPTIEDHQVADLTFECQVMLSFISMNEVKLAPGESVSMAINAILKDLKEGIHSAFRDVYIIMKNLKVTEIQSLIRRDEGDFVLGVIDEKMKIFVFGTGIDIDTRFRNEACKDMVLSYWVYSTLSGSVLSCKVVEKGAMSKGFRFIQFDSEESAMVACAALHDTLVHGRKL